MMQIDQLFDRSLLEQMLAQGMVRAQFHPTEKLTILNYTPAAVYSKTWNPVTLACRGLIVNSENDYIVSRPFPKFFNWDQPEVGKLPTGTAIVAPKMDGSLGIMYRKPSNGRLAVATRGSFTSPQAEHASDLLRGRYAGFTPVSGVTYLFEIIYPQNRIVVNYGEQDMLVLLDVIDNETGRSDIAEFDACPWPIKVPRKNVNIADSNANDLHRILDEVPEDEEGLVFYFPGRDLRFKMKKAEYIRLHRIVTNVTSRSLWETLANGGSFNELLERVPDEFYSWVKQTVADFEERHRQRTLELQSQYFQILAALDTLHGAGKWSRKDFAVYVTKNHKKDAAHHFAALDGKNISKSVWAELKPAYEKPFITNASEEA